MVELKIEWTWENLGIKMTVEGENGCVMVRDLDGNAMHAEHMLNLVRNERVAEHREAHKVG